MNASHDNLIANHWRNQRGYTGRGGVVVLFFGEVQGWCNQLRNPEHWQPGCIAIDEQGNHWTAIGGNARDGAVEWRLDQRAGVEKQNRPAIATTTTDRSISKIHGGLMNSNRKYNKKQTTQKILDETKPTFK